MGIGMGMGMGMGWGMCSGMCTGERGRICSLDCRLHYSRPPSKLASGSTAGCWGL